MEEKMHVLIVEPHKKPYFKDIDKSLESLQHEVGGWIEATYPYDDPVAIICNEEGKINGLELNRAVRDEDGEIMDIIAGTFIVAGLGSEDFVSLSDEMAKKYEKEFSTPELFVRINGKLIVIPVNDEKAKGNMDSMAKAQAVDTISKDNR